MRVEDARLHAQPAVMQEGEGLVLRPRYLTPLRLSLTQTLLLYPLQMVWRAALLFFMLLFVLNGMGVWLDVLPPHEVPRWKAYLGLGVLFFLWRTELHFGYPVLTWLLGRRMEIRITADEVTVKRSRSRIDRYPRTHSVTFGIEPIRSSSSPVYQHAMKLLVVVDDSRRIAHAEVFDPQRMSPIIENLNLALLLAEGSARGEMDLDPLREKRPVL
ncbi:MAG: hypothetical protein AAF191_08500 [Verrucomicrobiota bacterium]